MKKLMLCAAAGVVSLFAATPAEMAVQKAETEVRKNADSYAAYNSLAMALARRARETSDVAFYAQSEEALHKSFSLSAANYGGRKVQTWLLLGRHEFAKARDLAIELNRQMPDDVTVYGYLADANAELGNYQEAVDATQWMLNLRPGNVPGLTRAAYLRELHGDFDGAIDLMQQAYESAPSQEMEDRAWLLVQIAHLQLLPGRLAEAERYATGALALFDGYHYALGVLAQIRMAQKDYAGAAELFRKRFSAAPHAENLFALGEALHLAGNTDGARKVFADFEKQALKESTMADNANHELVAYYNDYAHAPEKALRIAEQELARRHDAYTLDAYAWSLAESGDYTSAALQMRRALAFGIRDPKVIRHAEAIAAHSAAAE